MKVRTHSLLFSAKELHQPKSLSCLEFGDVVITRRLSLAEYLYTQPCFKNVVAGVVWPCEIPPGWELEWVEEDE
jgi:hypothetical protein